jgi:hypothetical protein
MPFKGRILNEEVLSSTVNSEEGSINATLTTEQGELSGSLNADTALTGRIELQERALNATVNADAEGLSARLSIHYGADGQPGKDGYSPTITVYEQTDTTYILKITDVNGSYLTPNLQGQDGEGGGKGKVDEDLVKYRLVDPTKLTPDQRDQSLLYVRRNDLNEGNKVTLSHIALTQEVDQKIKQKLQTVTDRATTQWKIGDYIFLEVPGEDDK